MTPAQFLARMKRKEIAPAYLLLGSEPYERGRCRNALLDAALGATPREDGLTQHDLSDASIALVIDDARALSLFTTERVIWVSNAEAALPRPRGEDEGEDGEGSRAGAGALSDYLKDPSPGVTLVFESSRYDFDSSDDKRKLDRVRKLYAAISELVELRRYSTLDARNEAQTLSRLAGLRVEPSALDLLVDALGADIARISLEIEKLSLFGADKAITVDDIAALVPDARATSIFALVAALGRRDRTRALQILDTLFREGEYLPLALAFLSTQFRMALVAQESGLRSAQQIQGYFTKTGVPVWQSRAEQISQTVSKFSRSHIERVLKLLYEADKGLRDARPDDRIIMERLVLQLTQTL